MQQYQVVKDANTFKIEVLVCRVEKCPIGIQFLGTHVIVMGVSNLPGNIRMMMKLHSQKDWLTPPFIIISDNFVLNFSQAH